VRLPSAKTQLRTVKRQLNDEKRYLRDAEVEDAPYQEAYNGKP
jgi:hypothetical protein